MVHVLVPGEEGGNIHLKNLSSIVLDDGMVHVLVPGEEGGNTYSPEESVQYLVLDDGMVHVLVRGRKVVIFT